MNTCDHEIFVVGSLLRNLEAQEQLYIHYWNGRYDTKRPLIALIVLITMTRVFSDQNGHQKLMAFFKHSHF